MVLNKRQISEFASDVHNCLERNDAPDFYQLRKIGMAAALSVHIQGLGEINGEVLRGVSDHYFNIPSYALDEVLEVLAEIEFVQLIKVRNRIDKIIPRVPRFQDIYECVGEYLQPSDLNEHEQATLTILNELSQKPDNKDKLLNSTGIPLELFNRCISVGTSGNFIREVRTRGRNILINPCYFGDNYDSLADLAVSAGASEIQKVLTLIKENQGWPLSLIENNLQIGGERLSKTQKELIKLLTHENLLKPPTIVSGNREEQFIFTPQPGRTKLNLTNRDIYERAIALVSAVRKGQLLPEVYAIKSPIQLLKAFRTRGYIQANSEAKIQYRNLTTSMKVATLKPVGDRWELHLRDSEENRSALDLAINLIETGDLAGMEINQEARLALSKDEKYIQSITSSAMLRKRSDPCIDEQAIEEFENLLLKI